MASCPIFPGPVHELGILERITRIQLDLYGSLAKTGRGHGTDIAVMLSLSGEDPVTCETGKIQAKINAIRSAGLLLLQGMRPLEFHPETDLLFHPDITLPFHPNGMKFTAFLDDGDAHEETYYSIGGGFVVQEKQAAETVRAVALPFPLATAADLSGHCRTHNLTIPEVVWRMN